MTYVDLDDLEVIEKVASFLKRAGGDETITIERTGEKWILMIKKSKLLKKGYSLEKKDMQNWECPNIDGDGCCKVDGRECSIMKPNCELLGIQLEIPKENWYQHNNGTKTLTDW